MRKLPADVARCRGRVCPEDAILADECLTCKRWVAHCCDEKSDGIVAVQEPPTARDCPLRLAVDESMTPNVAIKPRRQASA